ncbi:MAG TPA: hypothetical protein VIL99_14305 [Ignavibacteria bacterium]
MHYDDRTGYWSLVIIIRINLKPLTIIYLNTLVKIKYDIKKNNYTFFIEHNNEKYMIENNDEFFNLCKPIYDFIFKSFYDKVTKVMGNNFINEENKSLHKIGF